MHDPMNCEITLGNARGRKVPGVFIFEAGNEKAGNDGLSRLLQKKPELLYPGLHSLVDATIRERQPSRNLVSGYTHSGFALSAWRRRRLPGRGGSC